MTPSVFHGTCYDSLSSQATHPMILSQASRLTDRQTVWVARKNDDSSFYRLTTDYGVPATVWAAQFADVHAADVAPCPVSGWVSQQG